jgi:DNA-binding NarL/FixJ family response regulator
VVLVGDDLQVRSVTSGAAQALMCLLPPTEPRPPVPAPYNVVAALPARANQLSRRQGEVLRLALHGMDTRAIASELVIAHSTAEDHLKALLAKTGSASRHQLLARALGG